tara:strand:+ start:209 stop:424 length:216 start_codon:yes stop_codon:yes gene_type:complete
MSKSMKAICSSCGAYYSKKRLEAGFNTCLDCGEHQARKVKHTIAPMHKSNYVVISDKADLKGINNKGGFHK